MISSTVFTVLKGNICYISEKLFVYLKCLGNWVVVLSVRTNCKWRAEPLAVCTWNGIQTGK